MKIKYYTRVKGNNRAWEDITVKKIDKELADAVKNLIDKLPSPTYLIEFSKITIEL